MWHQSEVYIVDDEPTQRSLTSLLRTAGFRSRTYDSGSVFLKVCARLPPGCIITGLQTPGMYASEFIRRLNAEHSPFPAIIIAGGSDVSQAVEAMKAGAANVIEWPYADEALLGAVRSALGADAHVSPHVAKQRVHRKALATLTPREQEVLSGVLEGKTNKGIARDHGISPRTVEVYRASVMRKSGAHSLADLVRMALLANHTAGSRVAERA